MSCFVFYTLIFSYLIPIVLAAPVRIMATINSWMNCLDICGVVTGAIFNDVKLIMKRSIASVKDFAEFVIKHGANDTFSASRYLTHKVFHPIHHRSLWCHCLCRQLKAGIKYVVYFNTWQTYMKRALSSRTFLKLGRQLEIDFQGKWPPELGNQWRMVERYLSSLSS